jgi:hypothetical protein
LKEKFNVVTIRSKEPTIDLLRFEQIHTGRKYSDCDVYKEKDLVVIKLKNKKLFSNIPNGEYPIGNYPWLSAVLSALVALKVVTKEAVSRHMALVKKNYELSSLTNDMKLVASICKRYGWKVDFKK